MSQLLPATVDVPRPDVHAAPERLLPGDSSDPRRRRLVPGWLRLLLGNPKSRAGLSVILGMVLLLVRSLRRIRSKR